MPTYTIFPIATVVNCRGCKMSCRPSVGRQCFCDNGYTNDKGKTFIPRRHAHFSCASCLTQWTELLDMYGTENTQIKISSGGEELEKLRQ